MSQGEFRFDGFSNPNYTQVPDELFDQLLPFLKEAELKTLLYIIRRTFGFKRSSDAISFNQFLKGITTNNGRQLDLGCGIKSPTNLSNALKSLEAKGVITARKQTDAKGRLQTTTYTLRFRAEVLLKEEQPHNGVLPEQEYPTPVTGAGVLTQQERQETVKQETDDKRQISNYSKRQMTISELDDAEKKHREIERWTHPERFRG